MSTHRKRTSAGLRIGEVVETLGKIAPPWLAQSWDNVGLLAGDPDARCARVLLCIDMTRAVVQEADRIGAGMIVAYHPPIFEPVSRLVASSPGTDALVWLAVSNRIAIYALHTALDAAEGGTNDVLAELCGLGQTAPFEYVPAPGESCKVVVFVPPDCVDRVAEAAFAAGAGRIGQYEKCSFRAAGEGTFFGTEQTSPAVGRKGRLERVEELRLELICPQSSLGDVLDAIRRAHPYEEPAIDAYRLVPGRAKGIGRYGELARPQTLRALARRLKRVLGLRVVQLVGEPDRKVRRVAICAGSAGRLPLEAGPPAAHADVVITGEIRHHDALAYMRCGRGAIALGHWASERPVLDRLAERLRRELPALDVHISRQDGDPFAAV